MSNCHFAMHIKPKKCTKWTISQFNFPLQSQIYIKSFQFFNIFPSNFKNQSICGFRKNYLRPIFRATIPKKGDYCPHIAIIRFWQLPSQFSAKLSEIFMGAIIYRLVMGNLCNFQILIFWACFGGKIVVVAMQVPTGLGPLKPTNRQ